MKWKIYFKMENYVSHLVYIDLDFDVAVYDETYKRSAQFFI